MAAPTPALQAVLDGPARWTRIEYHDEVTSTNDIAAAHIAEGVGPGLVVVTDRQTAGRGRGGRPWVDPGRPGASLLCSLVVALPAANVTLVPLATGLAVQHAIKSVGGAAQLKWPNDALIDGRKVAGMLVEHHGGSGMLIVGVGIDLDWRGIERDDESSEWVSVAEATGRDAPLWDVLAALLASVDSWIRDVALDPSVLLALYRRRCTTIGRPVNIQTPAAMVSGQAIGIDDTGALLVRGDDGRQVRVDAGDVTHG